MHRFLRSQDRWFLTFTLTLFLLGTVHAVQAQGTPPTPLPPVALSGMELEQSVNEAGYPQLGRNDAPVQVREYCSFDAEDCIRFHVETFPALLQRVATGEIMVTFAPLYGEGEITNGRSAARAAVCAAQTGAFWALSETLYDQAAEDPAALEGVNLVAAVDATVTDRSAWDACMSSDLPDSVLDTARAEVEAYEEFDGDILPFILVGGVPSLPDEASLNAAMDLLLERAAATLPPTVESSGPTATPDPEATPDVLVTIEPLLGEQIAPPLNIALPSGWQRGYDVLLLDDVDVQMRNIPLAVYTGPVTGGQGTIVLLWGFPNLINANPFAGEAVTPDLWSDGLRLLRLAIIEQGCNIGTDLRSEYTIGGVDAVGTQFSAVDCPELPDTRGWFAGLRESGINFVFYVFTEPIEAMNVAEPELQAILDSVTFDVPSVATATPG